MKGPSGCSCSHDSENQQNVVAARPDRKPSRRKLGPGFSPSRNTKSLLNISSKAAQPSHRTIVAPALTTGQKTSSRTIIRICSPCSTQPAMTGRAARRRNSQQPVSRNNAMISLNNHDGGRKTTATVAGKIIRAVMIRVLSNDPGL